MSEKTARDTWDKFEILTKPLVAFFTALTIAIISYFGQKTITALSLQDQNARLYTELLARREDAESSLRKDMFKEIMGGFFTSSSGKITDIENQLSKKILKLELLAINFGDSLSIGPLFSEMSKDIERQLETNKENISDWKNVASVYQKRLRSLAKRVASSQLSTILPSGQAFSFEVPTDQIETNSLTISQSDWLYTWPFDDPDGESQYRNTIELDGVSRTFEISFRNASYENQSVQINLVILQIDKVEQENPQGEIEIIERQSKVTNQVFTLDFFNFPLIDNTRLSNNQRFSLVLENFDTNTLKVSGMVFPGLYASQRDKPFLNEAIDELGDQRKLPID